MSTELALIKIAGRPLLGALHDGNALVPMPQLCRDIGLDWEPQRKRILRNDVLAEGTSIITVPSAGGAQETLCLPVRLAYVFIVTLTLHRIRDADVRAFIKALQIESFDAMYDYWTKGAAINPRAARPMALDTAIRAMLRLYDALKTETDDTVRQSLHTALDRVLTAIDVPAPPLSSFDTPQLLAKRAVQATLDLFWERIEWLSAQGGAALNHHRDSRFVAYSLPEVESRCARARLSLPPTGELRAALRLDPRFVGNKTVNSGEGKTVQCWVFEAPVATPQS